MSRIIIFALFFLSGAAGLVYEVAWARSLGLVFGASHIAVTTVLAVYMGGQALGSTLFGLRADRSARPLRLYGWLELGVGLSALASVGLVRLYPWLYPPVARVAEESGAWLTAVRTVFAVVAMAIPTTLMGGTLPILSRYVARRSDGVGAQVALLYALNTTGAVAGALAAGFVLIRALGVEFTLCATVAVSIGVGLLAIALDRLDVRADVAAPSTLGATGQGRHGESVRAPTEDFLRLALIGAGVSGFCALGYEVLWTRMLTLVAGTSVYSFTVMLVAFLSGLGLGSHAFARLGPRSPTGRSATRLFGVTQVAIGLAALATTVLMRELPSVADWLRQHLVSGATSQFANRVAASFGAAIAFMFVPCFLMGLAFPLASAAWGNRTDGLGASVGRLLSFNTVGAILGTVVSGFVLIYVLGIERSLHVLVILNVGAGLCVLAGLRSRALLVVAVGATCAVLALRVGLPDWGRAWDQKYFATYVNNARSGATPGAAREALADVEVVYYREGVNETVSVTRSKNGEQSFIVNGRPEASTALMDVQLQRALGHLPMLLHPNPRRVFVLGTGSGMTLGATSIHPGVERVVLAEIEQGTLGVARSFAAWNHAVLDDPRLHVVLNDGRNFLATTRERFDVITADPIHPWSGGAGYLYTAEYFRSLGARLEPGGVVSQWLPLYELTLEDVKTVVRTFAESFRHVAVWLTYYDAILVGSNDPLVIDQAALARRLEAPAVQKDLASVFMGTADDLLSYFVMGTKGARAFGEGGDLNTDDNVTLEFSAPESQGVARLDAVNVAALHQAQESLLPLLKPAVDEDERRRQEATWTRREETARRFGEVHAAFLIGERTSPTTLRRIAELQTRDPTWAPLRFLLEELELIRRSDPALVQSAEFAVRTATGAPSVLRLSAVRQWVGRRRVLVSFVDNGRREIFGQGFVDGEFAALERASDAVIGETMHALRAAAARVPPSPQGLAPDEQEVVAALRAEAAARVGRLDLPRGAHGPGR